MTKPTVGRTVHYYTKNPTQQFNGIGEGPYAAIITQVHGEGDNPYVSVIVFPPFAQPYTQGSIHHMADNEFFRTGEINGFAWPPRV